MFDVKGKTEVVKETVEIEKEVMFRPFSLQFNTRRDCEAAAVLLNAAGAEGLDTHAGDSEALERAYDLYRRLGTAIRSGQHLPRDTQLSPDAIELIGE